MMVAFLASLLPANAARAEVVEGGGDVPPVSEAPMGRLAVRRGVQGPAGLFTARLQLFVNASKDNFATPTSLAPDLYYSISDTIQIGLVHTGPMGWQSLPGQHAGLCLSGDGDGGCPHVYDNVGLDFMYGLLYGDFHLSLHSSLYVLRIAEPLWPMWTVGVTGKFHFTDMVALFFDPQIGISLANRSDNKDWLFLPVELQFQVAAPVSLKLLSGVAGQLSNLGDTYRVPLGVGVVGNLNSHLDLGLRFSFDNLLGNVPMGGSRTDLRSLVLLANIRV